MDTPYRSNHETNWSALAEAVETVHSLSHIDDFDTLMRENRLHETTILQPSHESGGICIQESMLCDSNLAGIFNAPNVTIRDFSLAVSTFSDGETAVHGQFKANGALYHIVQQGTMTLITEANAPEMPGFAVEISDIKQLLGAQIAVACEGEPDVITSVLECFHTDSNEISALHDATFAFGNVYGKSIRRLSATFEDSLTDEALIVQYSATESPDQSEERNQLDIGYAADLDTYEAGELYTYERAVPHNTEQNHAAYHGVTMPTDMTPQDVIEQVRLNGKLDEFDMLLGKHLEYPASKKSTAKEYGELCQQLVKIIEPKLLEIAAR